MPIRYKKGKNYLLAYFNFLMRKTIEQIINLFIIYLYSGIYLGITFYNLQKKIFTLGYE